MPVTANARLYDYADAAFFETLQAQGRSLLRFLHVSLPFTSLCYQPSHS